MTKPLPDCGRMDEGPCGFGSGCSRRRRPLVPVDRVVASILTTAGLMRSATSAKFTRPAANVTCFAGTGAGTAVASVAPTGAGSATDACGIVSMAAGGGQPIAAAHPDQP